MLSCARNEGVDVDRLLGRLGLAASVLDDPDFRIAESVGLEAWRLASEESGDTAFGLHVAEHSGIGAYDVLDYACAYSATLTQAFERLSRFHRILDDALEVTVQPDGPNATWRVSTSASGHPAENFLALVVLRGRELTAADVVPDSVRFAHRAPRDLAARQRLFRCPVRFGCRVSELSFKARHLDVPIRLAKPDLAKILDRLMKEVVARLPEQSFVHRARRVIASTLRGGAPTIDATARAMHTSARTLQRRLGEYGTNHRDLIEAARRDLGVKFVTERALSITEIAFLLGYHDIGTFRRAFKRWTGKTPAALRPTSPGVS
jgi:AraC-like DNA-binding protein